ncbi:MAG: hypothetical protein NT019_03420 [Candidatus Adlerbacteria bacterium]|nr:hypothetical protein [Candidatus Adlerbacteria bacterium]
MFEWAVVIFGCLVGAFFFIRQLRDMATIDRNVAKIKADAAKM